MTEQPARPASLAEALILLQSRLPRITRDSTGQVGTREYRYANLAAIHDAVFPLLADCGLYWTCVPTMTDGTFTLDYALSHASGESIGGHYPLPDGASPQAQGSAITYAKRYALCAVLGIAPADDDDDGARAEAAHEVAHDWRPPANPRTRKAQRSRNTAGEDTDWTTSPDDAPGTITDQQLKAIGDYWVSLGIPAEDRRPLVLAGSDETVNRIRDLSKAGGDKLLAYLRNVENSTEGGA